MTRLHRLLSSFGQSVWIDFLSRDFLESGALARAIADDAAVGVTSNPTIFEKALAHGDAYDAQLAARGRGNAKRIFHALAMRDVASACDLLRPRLGANSRRRRLRLDRGRPQPRRRHPGDDRRGGEFHDAIAKPNLLVKIPATDAGVGAIEEMTARAARSTSR